MKFHRAVCGILLNSFYMHTQHGRPETRRLFMQQRDCNLFSIVNAELGSKFTVYNIYEIHSISAAAESQSSQLSS